MTSEEILRAMRRKQPVRAWGIEYRCIREYVLTLDDRGRQRRSVGLLDRNGSALVRVVSSAVEPLERIGEEEG